MQSAPATFAGQSWPAMTVLVLLDGSSGAERAISYAVNVARSEGGRLVLAARRAQPATSLPAGGATASLYLRRVARVVAGRGLAVETVLLHSAGARAISALVCDWRADLVVMVAPESDTAGYAGATTLAGEILCRTGVPVLLLPAPGPPAPPDALRCDDQLLDLRWRWPAAARQRAPGTPQEGRHDGPARAAPD